MQRTKRISNLTVKMTITLAKACRLLKIKDKLTWYSARASFITRMVDQGYSPYVVAEMAGNSPMVIYKHYYKNTKADEMLKEMNSIFGEYIWLGLFEDGIARVYYHKPFLTRGKTSGNFSLNINLFSRDSLFIYIPS